MLAISPYPTFEEAAHETLRALHARLGFDLWMVTRAEGDHWIVLQAEDHGYGVKDGTVFRWVDSFCSRMIRNEGPRVAPRSDDVPAYASAPIGRQVPIGAYVGIPLNRADGSLFGTLCAIHPSPLPDAVATELPLIELLGRLLCTVLATELQAAEQGRQVERARAEALTDGLTGLYNRRGWDQLLAAEEERCRRLGHPACVVSIDLDGLKRVNDTEGHARGDELIQRAARAIREAVRAHDVVARLGGDEFAVLGVECDTAGAAALRDRVCAALPAAAVAASVGLAQRDPRSGLAAACDLADRAMYAQKAERRKAGSRS